MFHSISLILVNLVFQIYIVTYAASRLRAKLQSQFQLQQILYRSYCVSLNGRIHEFHLGGSKLCMCKTTGQRTKQGKTAIQQFLSFVVCGVSFKHL